jgi:type IV pilus assembly protein PilE
MNAYMRGEQGFSLVELLVVLVIISILAAIAVPGYRTYAVRTHRAAAKSCMLETAQFMERYYTTNPTGLTYAGAAIPDGGCRTEGNLNTRYTLSLDTLAQNTYRIVATPVGAQALGDAACGVLTLDQSGTRTEAGSSDVDTCWSR